MNTQQKIIVGGFGGSGSSAVIDLLREVEDCELLGPELRIISDPGGFLDLEHVLLHDWSPYKTDHMIRQFRRLLHLVSKGGRYPYINQDFTSSISKEFDTIVKDFWKDVGLKEFRGLWVGRNNPLTRLSKSISKLSGGKISPIKRKMYIADPGEGFYEASIRFFNRLCSASTAASRVIIDEGYSSLQPRRVLRLFDNAAVVIIHRDPRDTYINAQRYNYSFAPREVGGFISWYRALMRQSGSYADDRILRLQFEDLVNEYESVSRQIFRFLNIHERDHRKQMEYFNPSRSKTNIGLWRKYNDQDAVKRIETELSEYCRSL